ncbi:hypothetical protein QBC43DRAFT_365899 [Cladorrhinum sp. PSN259]|nr:hypothetical protein QBC43DRAFT_365899 [Cladorrhinum sp. PSN259]
MARQAFLRDDSGNGMEPWSSCQGLHAKLHLETRPTGEGLARTKDNPAWHAWARGRDVIYMILTRSGQHPHAGFVELVKSLSNLPSQTPEKAVHQSAGRSPIIKAGHYDERPEQSQVSRYHEFSRRRWLLAAFSLGQVGETGSEIWSHKTCGALFHHATDVTAMLFTNKAKGYKLSPNSRPASRAGCRRQDHNSSPLGVQAGFSTAQCRSETTAGFNDLDVIPWHDMGGVHWMVPAGERCKENGNSQLIYLACTGGCQGLSTAAALRPCLREISFSDLLYSSKRITNLGHHSELRRHGGPGAICVRHSPVDKSTLCGADEGPQRGKVDDRDSPDASKQDLITAIMSSGSMEGKLR